MQSLSPMQTKSTASIFESVLTEIASKANIYIDSNYEFNDSSGFSIEYQKLNASTSSKLAGRNYCGCGGGNCVC